MNSKAQLLATVLGLGGVTSMSPFMRARSEPSANQLRRQQAWIASAPERFRVAAEIERWNAAVDARNAEKKARKAARRSKATA